LDFFWNAWITHTSAPSWTAYTTRYASPRKASANSKTPEPKPLSGLAIDDVPPSAATVRASSSRSLAFSGKSSKSRRAAFSQTIGRVFLIGYGGKFVTRCQVSQSDPSHVVGRRSDGVRESARYTPASA